MPYLLLALGLIIGFYAFSRFFVNASPEEIKRMLWNGSIAVVVLAVAVLALTGRLVPGLLLLIMFLPVWIKFFGKGATASPQAPASTASMSENEALEVLGLNTGAGEDDIQNAYRKLMQKVHPDNQGSDWMAAKLNQARDVLIK